MSIRVEQVTKFYGQQKALDNISFEVAKGEIVGFLGPNGAGKSTMMKIISGYISANSGKISLNEINISESPIESKKNLGYLPELNPLYPDMYIREYLDFVTGIYKIKKNRKQLIEKIIITTGLERESHKKIGALSKGYKQRVGLAAALIHDPQVLILDEPTSGLDPNQIIEIRNLITKLGEKKTVLLSTHIMQEVEAICDRVIIIDKGKIVAKNSAKAILEEADSEKITLIVEFEKNININDLKSLNGVINVKNIQTNKCLIEAEADSNIRIVINSFVKENDNSILEMQTKRKNLEEVFYELTN